MRRSILPPRATRRQLVVPARHITTKPATIANIVYDLLQRRAKKYWQDLTPRNSDLLACSLNDFLPWEAKTPFPPPEPDARRTHPDPQDLLLWGHHLVYFAPCPATTSLLPDGTDADHSPGPPFTRRLWAGGSLIFNVDPGPVLSKPDHVPRPEPIDNADAGVLPRGVCIEEIEDVRVAGVPPGVDAWTGGAPGAGEKVFVDLIRKYGWVRDGGGTGRLTDNEAVSQEVRTDLGQRGPSIVERRTLCFMAPKTVDEARRDVESPHRRAVKAPAYEPTYSFSLTPTRALLFRFSALTLNAHAIHLDRQHCREVEGYRDLLVHGPLLLTLMLAALRGALSRSPGARVARLDYRNLAPVYVDEQATVCVREGSEGAKWDVWVVGPEGGLCVKGTAVIEENELPSRSETI